MSKSSSTREKFIKMRGGKLISVESVILGVAIFFVLLIVKSASPYLALAIAFGVGFVFPILIGVFKVLAWIAAIVFSLLWALMAGVLVGAIASNANLISVLIGIVIFAISLVIHKNYSGLTFQGITRKKSENVLLKNSGANIPKESVKFCPKCGRRIVSLNGLCENCDR